jgi:hypothetical protein
MPTTEANGHRVELTVREALNRALDVTGGESVRDHIYA